MPPRVVCCQLSLPSEGLIAWTRLLRPPTIIKSVVTAALLRKASGESGSEYRQTTSALRQSMAKKTPPSVPK